MFNILVIFLVFSGLFSGFLVTKLSIDECRGKEWLFRYLLIVSAIIFSFTSLPESVLSLFLVFIYAKKFNDNLGFAFSLGAIIALFFSSNYLSALVLFINNHLLGSVYYLRRNKK